MISPDKIVLWRYVCASHLRFLGLITKSCPGRTGWQAPAAFPGRCLSIQFDGTAAEDAAGLPGQLCPRSLDRILRRSVTRSQLSFAWRVSASRGSRAVPRPKQASTPRNAISVPFSAHRSSKIEPTFTIENVLSPARVETIEDGVVVETMRQERDRVFELVLAVDIPTEIPRIGFTVETIFSPLRDDTEVELEFELNVTWLEPEQTGGWVESHFDIIDKFSPAERPTDTTGLHSQTELRAGHGGLSIQRLAGGQLAAERRTGGVARLRGDGPAEGRRRDRQRTVPG